ncbi:TPA: hypothetical protein N0F65_000655 [Lagenidium giganteum]|uniref:PIPK domain-containing protein n=1 Tax=Lagenidium giganteum TaxID=4803 RepID=A0AAV2YN89_9STRA|nr:TPA: hypothetical protein N0F65_000655 [Lagenidium giganteum]
MHPDGGYRGQHAPPVLAKSSSSQLSDLDANTIQDDAPMRPPSASLRTCFHSSTRWFQLIMFVAFVISLALGMCGNYERLSTGLVWGAILSIFSVFFVIISYVSVPSYRQHPNPLVFWRTIADAFFVLQLLAQQFVRCLFFNCDPLCSDSTPQCGCSTVDGSGATCDVFAGLFEFSLIAAECWFLCMTLNLLLSLTNPFTDFKRNTRMFHVFCWGMGLFLGLLLMNTHDWAGYSDLGVCWTNALRSLPAKDIATECKKGATVISNFKDDYKAVRANIVSWGFFYVWMALIIACGIAVWIWAWKRLSEGMPETYAVRVQSINRARFNVLAVTFYWIIVGAVYISYLSRATRDKKDWQSELLNFVIAGKGYVDLVIWFALNDFRLSHFTHCFSGETEEVDVDLNPQVNAALRREVLFYTTSGIIQAVQAAERLPASQRIQHLALLPQNKNAASGGAESSRNLYSQNGYNSSQYHSYPPGADAPAFDENMRVAKNSQRTKTFHDYEPHSFRRIRERFGVNNEAYLQSLSATAKERLSEGASGAFMFFSADGSLIVKSTSKEECTFLRSIAQQYADYLCANPKSLLTRFYGCHCLELYGKQFSFIVMANLFDTEQVIHQRYDIKGSWVNRHGELPKRGKKVTCRHCNRKYIYQNSAPENANCPMRLGGHEPNVVLKDSDLTQKLKLDRDVALELYQQLRADSDMLCSFGIMDYSLLMGVHEVEYFVDESAGSMDEGTVSPPNFDGSAYNPFAEKSMLDPRGTTVSSFSATSPAPASQPPRQLRHHVSMSSNSSTPDNLYGRKKQREARTASNASMSSSGRRLPRSGMRMANTVVGPAYYHLGIIDILQTLTLNKRLERFSKIVFKGVDADGLSAIQPELYKERFQAKMADILNVEDLVDADTSDHFTQQNSHMDVDTSRGSHLNIHSMRSVTTDHFVSAMDAHYVDGGRGDGHGSLRHRGLDNAQTVGQPTEEYSGIDYHL